MNDDFRAYANSSARNAGVPEDLFARLIGAESSWNPNAIGPILPNGERALGIAQIRPSAHPFVNANDPYASLDYAAGYLRSLYDEFGSWDLAVAGYNAGPSKVKENNYNVPSQSRSFVDKIIGRRDANLMVEGASGSLVNPSEKSPISTNKLTYLIAIVMLVLAFGALNTPRGETYGT